MLHFVSSLHLGLHQIFILGSQGISAYSWGTFRTGVILIYEQTALLLPQICLARSNTKWVGRRYCYSCIRNDCSNVLFNTQLEKNLTVQSASGKKIYMISVSSIVCWVSIYEKKYLKYMHRTRAICLNNFKYITKYMHSFHLQNRHCALGFVISLLLLHCGLTTKPAQALKQNNNKAQQIFICAKPQDAAFWYALLDLVQLFCAGIIWESHMRIQILHKLDSKLNFLSTSQ